MDYDDRGLVALPKLVGGPKYSRPPVTGVQHKERPPDPDDLPIESERTPEDEALAMQFGLDGQPAVVMTMAASADPGTVSVYATGAAGLEGGVAASGSGRRGFGGLFRGKRGRAGAG